MLRNYKLNEIFLSLQGEGVRAGTPNVFVRFAGCNLRCSRDREGFDCDTDFQARFELDAKHVLSLARKVGKGCRNVVFTGGEPALQLDSDLLYQFTFDEYGWYTAVETNGTQALPEGIDWISVSPKTPVSELKLSRASELRYVLRRGDPLPEDDALHFESYHSPVLVDTRAFEKPVFTVSPAFEPAGPFPDRVPPRNLSWCVDLVQMNPHWRLSVQLHKTIGVR